MFELLMSQYGYEYPTDWGITHTDRVWWGTGSLVCGRTMYVSKEGKTFRVRFHSWEYDCNGDCVAEVREEYSFRRHADVIAYIGSKKCVR